MRVQSPAALISLLLLMAPAPTLGRVGGGQTYSSPAHSSSHSYSSSSHSSSSSSRSYSGSSGWSSGSQHGSSGYSGGGGGSLSTYDVKVLVFGVVAVALLLIIGVVADAMTPSLLVIGTTTEEGARAPGAFPSSGPAAGSRSLERGLERLRERDPAFSMPVLLDLLTRLYERIARARARGEPGPVLSFLWPGVIPALTGNRPMKDQVTSVDNVVVGSLVPTDLLLVGGTFHRLTVAIDASMRETLAGGEHRAVWMREVWKLRRNAGVLSRPPEPDRLTCAACGSPEETDTEGRCRSCGEMTNRGGFQWVVETIDVTGRETTLQEADLVSDGEEVGTDLPTRVQEDYGARFRSFHGRHPGFHWSEFRDHVSAAFMALQAAWTEGRWEKARCLETDSLYQTHRYWIERYQAAGLRNVLESVTIQDVIAVKIERDAFYEAFTVRIFATMLDYTARKDGTVVSGSATTPRRFSEYWTFLATIGTTLDVGALSLTCPSCSAPTRIAQTGVCAHCGSVITSGRFGWVLSRIQQDEAYVG